MQEAQSSRGEAGIMACGERETSGGWREELQMRGTSLSLLGRVRHLRSHSDPSPQAFRFQQRCLVDPWLLGNWKRGRRISLTRIDSSLPGRARGLQKVSEGFLYLRRCRANSFRQLLSHVSSLAPSRDRNHASPGPHAVGCPALHLLRRKP